MLAPSRSRGAEMSDTPTGTELAVEGQNVEARAPEVVR
jgi:hypothetical protein